MVSMNQNRKKTKKKISIDEEQYTEDLLKKQGMSKCNSLKTLVTGNEIIFSKQMTMMK